MERFWEVDFARGIGILMMLASNFVTDLQYFANYSAHETFWWLFAIATASIFLLVVGVSLNLSYSKDAKFNKFLNRGGFIFALGAIITVVTWIFVPEDFIRFGVLHLIGLSIIIAYPFLKLDKKFALAAGAAVILIGFLVAKLTAATNHLLFLGLTTANFSSLDYFPLFPWLGVVLIGVFLGKYLYPEGKRSFDVSDIRFSKQISFLGKNSLAIYLIHQPIFLTLLYFFIA